MIVVTKIPPLNSKGCLPVGIHWTAWSEFTTRFGINNQRQRLLRGLMKAIASLRTAGCNALYVDGSFVTSKQYPNDYDACWDLTNVDPLLLDPIFIGFDPVTRFARKKRFLGDLYPAQFSDAASGKAFLNFFQSDLNGDDKGIIGLKI